MTEATPAAPAPDTTPAVPTDPAAIAARDIELTALYDADPNGYRYADGGRLATEHAAIRRAQQAQAEKSDPAKPAEQPDATADVVDAEDIDIDVLADDAEGDEAGDGETLDLSAYEALPEGVELSDTGEALIGIVNEHCEARGLGPEGRDGLLDLHSKLIEAQNARLADADKAAQQASVEALGGREAYAATVETAKSVLRTWPKELADAVRSARTSDGRRLALLPEFVRALAGMGDRQATAQPQDRTAVLKAEIAEIDAEMHRDADSLYRPYKNTGMLATDYKLKALRELASEGPAKPSSADLRAEERKLVKLSQDDPQLFQFGAWPSARSPADRLHAIRSGRA